MEALVKMIQKPKSNLLAEIMKGILITAFHIAVLAGTLFIYIFSVTGWHL